MDVDEEFMYEGSRAIQLSEIMDTRIFCSECWDEKNQLGGVNYHCEFCVGTGILPILFTEILW